MKKLEIWKELSKKYPDYKFGYRDDGGDLMHVSVSTKSFTQSVRRVIDARLEGQAFANVFLELLKEIKGEKTDVGQELSQPVPNEEASEKPEESRSESQKPVAAV